MRQKILLRQGKTYTKGAVIYAVFWMYPDTISWDDWIHCARYDFEALIGFDHGD